MRYERKYRISSFDLDWVRQSVKHHPASFRKIFPDRQINNIYWDTVGLQMYKDNVMGIAKRQKFRLRWYGNEVTNISNPKLEIKKRMNELGDKDIFNINPFQINTASDLSTEIEELTKVNTNLIPVILNSYKRSYWGTPDRKFRITIDYDMQFHSLMNEKKFRKYFLHDNAIILELKYDETCEEESDRITPHIPFRRSKNSKYVIGVEMTHQTLF